VILHAQPLNVQKNGVSPHNQPFCVVFRFEYVIQDEIILAQKRGITVKTQK